MVCRSFGQSTVLVSVGLFCRSRDWGIDDLVHCLIDWLFDRLLAWSIDRSADPLIHRLIVWCWLAHWLLDWVIDAGVVWVLTDSLILVLLDYLGVCLCGLRSGRFINKANDPSRYSLIDCLVDVWFDWLQVGCPSGGYWFIAFLIDCLIGWSIVPCITCWIAHLLGRSVSCLLESVVCVIVQLLRSLHMIRQSLDWCITCCTVWFVKCSVDGYTDVANRSLEHFIDRSTNWVNDWLVVRSMLWWTCLPITWVIV